MGASNWSGGDEQQMMELHHSATLGADHQHPELLYVNPAPAEVRVSPRPMDKRLLDPQPFALLIPQPRKDALLLYLWLTGAYRDPLVRHIIAPVLRLGRGDTLQVHEALYHRVKRLKALLGIRRPSGRPPGRSRWDHEEVCYLLEEYMKYLGVWG